MAKSKKLTLSLSTFSSNMNVLDTRYKCEINLTMLTFNYKIGINFPNLILTWDTTSSIIPADLGRQGALPGGTSSECL